VKVFAKPVKRESHFCNPGDHAGNWLASGYGNIVSSNHGNVAHRSGAEGFRGVPR